MRRSAEARYAVYLVDPGPDRPGILSLLQEVLSVNTATAAEYLTHFPSLISLYEEEMKARNLADRFREFDAVAVVRPAEQPLAPAPVEEVEVPGQRPLQVALFFLGFLQLGVSAWWFFEGRPAAGFFGLLLGVYVLVYFGLRLRR